MLSGCSFKDPHAGAASRLLRWIVRSSVEPKFNERRILFVSTAKRTDFFLLVPFLVVFFFVVADFISLFFTLADFFDVVCKTIIKENVRFRFDFCIKRFFFFHEHFFFTNFLSLFTIIHENILTCAFGIALDAFKYSEEIEQIGVALPLEITRMLNCLSVG